MTLASKNLQKTLEAQDQLRSPAPTHALKGIEAFHVAEEILRSRGQVGVVIGSVSRALWNSEMDWRHCRDLDVMVLRRPPITEKSLHEEDRDTRIDWWLPKVTSHSNPEQSLVHWTNRAGTVLFFGAETNSKFLPHPGLYVPSATWVATAMEYEARAWAAWHLKINFAEQPRQLEVLRRVQESQFEAKEVPTPWREITQGKVVEDTLYSKPEKRGIHLDTPYNRQELRQLLKVKK